MVELEATQAEIAPGAGTGKAKGEGAFDRFIERVRRAFAEFLTIPTALIAGFLALSALAYYLDQLRVARGWPTIVSGSHESVSTLLGTIAASIITVTSITFSLLLIAVQQSAAALTGQVYDQFLRRRANQAYFGFFIGLALYCLVILATVREDYTPVYGAAIAFALTVVALYMLILLIYASIDQMRPVGIIASIRDHALAARKTQCPLLQATCPRPSMSEGASKWVRARESGFLTKIDAGRLEDLRRACPGAAEIRVVRCIGDYLSIGDPVVEVRYTGEEPGVDLVGKFQSAVRLERKRDLATDPSFAIEQIVNIAWTTISTSKQNPQPGRLACRALRDLVAQWSNEQEGVQRAGADCRIVLQDRVPKDLIRAFETLAVVASESMQHHTAADVYRALAMAIDRFDGELRSDAEGVIMRSLSMLGDHVLTAELDDSIDAVLAALPAGSTRSALARARDRLAESWGELNSRGTRVKSSGG